jgi:hypothetical protein
MVDHLSRVPFSLDPLIAEAKRRMKRRRLLVVASLVVVAAGGTGATLGLRGLLDSKHGYSNQQVLRAFKAEGLALHLTEWSWGRSNGQSSRVESEWFYRSRDHQFSVIVFHPDRIGTRFGGNAPTATASARNVVAHWPAYTLAPGEEARIRAALSRLGATRAR